MDSKTYRIIEGKSTIKGGHLIEAMVKRTRVVAHTDGGKVEFSVAGFYYEDGSHTGLCVHTLKGANLYVHLTDKLEDGGVVDHITLVSR